MSGEPTEHAEQATGGERNQVRTWLLGIITVVLVGAALKATSHVTMTLAFAFLVVLAVWPVDEWVTSRMPKRLRWLGHAAAMALVLLAILGFLFGLFFVARTIANELPGYADDLRNRLTELAQNSGNETVRNMVEQTLSQGQNDQGGIVAMVGGLARQTLSSFGTTLSIMTLVFFLSLIMLTEVPTWHRKLMRVGGSAGRTWVEAMAAAAERVRWYIWVRTLLGLATAVLYGIWLMVFGLDFIWVWVVLTFLLGYVPTLGSFIAGVLPFLYALATKDVATAIIIGAGLVVIEQVMGSFVDPKLQGKELSLSPAVILSSLLVWGAIWGPAGTLIAVPMTVLIVIVLAHLPATRPISLFLSDEASWEGLDKSVTPDSAKEG